MMFVKWFLLALLSFVTKLLNYPIAPFVVPFSNKEGHLPSWLSWFQTPDNPLDGDSGWKNEHWQWRYKLPKSLSRYVGRVGWLWRNSMYGFKIDVLGFPLTPDFTYDYRGNQEVSDKPYNPGYVYRTVTTTDGRKAFQFYAVLPATKSSCVRIMGGWKLWQSPKGNTKLQLALVFTPFKRRG